VSRIEAPNVLCPSARLKEGAILVGIVLGDGSVAFAADRLVVNQQFIENALQGRAPEKRFRFGDTCVKSGCLQWKGSRCGVIDQILEAIPPHGSPWPLPECSIRPQCRWYGQSGAAACRVCPQVVTDCLEESSETVQS
jgi:hypothetical protein